MTDTNQLARREDAPATDEIQNRAVTQADTASAPTQEEVDQIREGGRLMVEKRKELNKLTRQLEGLEWGNVKGASLSPATRYAIAELCYIAKANPQLHLFILGGGPYLNSQYWSDKANSDPYFIRHEQRNISIEAADQLRQRALEAEKEAKDLAVEDGFADVVRSLRMEAIECRAKARDLDSLRVEYGVPDFATAAYETTVWRYAPRAPLDQIVSGEIDGAPFVQIITECNWAPRLQGTNQYGKPLDPIGEAEPAKTARSRSMRRCLVKAFSAWMVPLEREIQRIEDAVVLEFRTLEADERQRKQLPSGPQQVQTGHGEPRQPDPEPSGQEVNSFSDADEKNAALRAFFGNLKDAGTDPNDRAAWARDHDLPESVSSWGPQEHRRALELLVGPERDKYLEGCRVLGLDAGDFAQDELERAPEGLRDYRELNRRLDKIANEDASEDAEQAAS